MAKLIILRHAESVYGNKIYAGNVDIPLSGKGVQQAIALSKFADSLAPDIVYTSRLIRAMETALIMLADIAKTIVRVDPNELGNTIMNQDILPFLELNELNERDYGELQNKSKEQVLELYKPEEIQCWRRGFYGIPPGGESFYSVVERVQGFMKSFVFPYVDNYNILIVAHQNTLRAIYYLLTNQTPQAIETVEFCNCEGIQFYIENGQVENTEFLAY